MTSPPYSSAPGSAYCFFVSFASLSTKREKSITPIHSIMTGVDQRDSFSRKFEPSHAVYRKLSIWSKMLMWINIWE